MMTPQELDTFVLGYYMHWSPTEIAKLPILVRESYCALVHEAEKRKNTK